MSFSFLIISKRTPFSPFGKNPVLRKSGFCVVLILPRNAITPSSEYSSLPIAFIFVKRCSPQGHRGIVCEKAWSEKARSVRTQTLVLIQEFIKCQADVVHRAYGRISPSLTISITK